jgi:diaminopropionate ammonia-lyase
MSDSGEKISWFPNPRARVKKTNNAATLQFSGEHIKKVRHFHQSLPQFKPTPLIQLSTLARHLKITDIRIKDESHRCGLNAFKVLGASYALSWELAKKTGFAGDNLDFSQFQLPENQIRLQALTCISATDGNHGRAVAWAARQLGCRAVVYMPRGTTPARLKNVQNLGAEASIIDGNYDDAVRLAARHAACRQWLLIQDTSWPGYEEIPTRAMQGYLTMFAEAFDQLAGVTPTHVFVQCGVGSLASSLQAYLLQKFGDKRPIMVVVEAADAACFLKSIRVGDGNPHKVGGELNTIMAGLSCGEPSRLAWEILRDYADMFVACPDFVTEKGMRILGNPFHGDDRVVSGESGAVTLGLLFYLLTAPRYAPLKEALNISPASCVLLFSTEGDTDPERYRKIVWGD